jgi:hypothetical protein
LERHTHAAAGLQAGGGERDGRMSSDGASERHMHAAAGLRPRGGERDGRASSQGLSAASSQSGGEVQSQQLWTLGPEGVDRWGADRPRRAAKLPPSPRWPQAGRGDERRGAGNLQHGRDGERPARSSWVGAWGQVPPVPLDGGSARARRGVGTGESDQDTPRWSAAPSPSSGQRQQFRDGSEGEQGPGSRTGGYENSKSGEAGPGGGEWYERSSGRDSLFDMLWLDDEEGDGLAWLDQLQQKGSRGS